MSIGPNTAILPRSAHVDGKELPWYDKRKTENLLAILKSPYTRTEQEYNVALNWETECMKLSIKYFELKAKLEKFEAVMRAVQPGWTVCSGRCCISSDGMCHNMKLATVPV